MTTQDVVKLRTRTGAGMLDCNKALDEAGGDLDKAAEILRKKGQAKAAKKIEERQVKVGIVHAYVHTNGKVGAMVELFCESDFVARNEIFQGLAHDLAMQIAASDPLYLKPEDIPAEILEKEKDIYREDLKGEAKPEEIIEKIIQGKLNKYYEETCLMEQIFIKDEDKKIEDLINDRIAQLGEKIEVGRFSRLEI
jgi:elongation factor Ts